jgi:hypothetical protein
VPDQRPGCAAGACCGHGFFVSRDRQTVLSRVVV